MSLCPPPSTSPSPPNPLMNGDVVVVLVRGFSEALEKLREGAAGVINFAVVSLDQRTLLSEFSDIAEGNADWVDNGDAACSRAGRGNEEQTHFVRKGDGGRNRHIRIEGKLPAAAFW